MMKCTTSCGRSIAVLLTIISTATARTWRSIDIPAINEIIESDPLLGSSSQLAMEDMSFLYGSKSTEEGNNVPSTYSTPAPTVANEPSNYLFSAVPSVSHKPSTMIEKVAPNPDENESNVPTWSPSARYQATNGGCGDDEILHRLVMYDVNDLSMIVKEMETSNVIFESKAVAANETNVASSTVPATSTTEYLCLKKATCYSADFANVTLNSGMSWELHQVVLATGIGTILVASGTEDESGCQFGVGEGSCATSCTGKYMIIVV